MQTDISEFTGKFTKQLEQPDPSTRSAMLLDDSATVTKIAEAGRSEDQVNMVTVTTVLDALVESSQVFFLYFEF